MASNKRWKKHKKVINRRRHKKIMATNFGPWFKIVTVIVLVGGMLALLWVFVRPPLIQLAGIKSGVMPLVSIEPTPKPTPTPHPLVILDQTEIQRDINLGDVDNAEEVRFATDPVRHKDRVYYAGGMDQNNEPKYDKIRFQDIVTGEKGAMNNAILENSDIFQLKVNDRWVVYLDHKRNGGGYIRAIDQNNGNNFMVKQYYTGMPTLSIEGDLLCWTERTGSYMDKVFLYDLDTKESQTIAMLEKTGFGQSDSDISAEKIVWAQLSLASSETKNGDTPVIGQLMWISLDENLSKDVNTFETGTNVFNPKTEGGAFAWMDQNGGPNPKLYLSVDGNEAIEVAEDVSAFDLGTNFLAYCTNQVMRVYYWGTGGFDVDISLPGEKCIFGGVSQDTVFYYVTGGISRNDIIKYVPVNELDSSFGVYYQQKNYDAAEASDVIFSEQQGTPAASPTATSPTTYNPATTPAVIR